MKLLSGGIRCFSCFCCFPVAGPSARCCKPCLYWRVPFVQELLLGGVRGACNIGVWFLLCNVSQTIAVASFLNDDIIFFQPRTVGGSPEELGGTFVSNPVPEFGANIGLLVGQEARSRIGSRHTLKIGCKPSWTAIIGR